MDPQVVSTQQWLDATYAGASGWVHVDVTTDLTRRAADARVLPTADPSQVCGRASGQVRAEPGA